MKTQFFKYLNTLYHIPYTLYLIFFFILILSLPSYAQIRTSVQTGNWSDAATWDCGCVPAPAENAVIANGHTVTLTANTTINGLTINAGGTLADNGKIMTVSGNLLLNGILDGRRNLNLSGTGTTIDGTGAKSDAMGSVTISNGNKTIQPSANLSIAGVFTINAGLAVTNYGAMTIAGALTGGSASSTWLNESNSALNAGNAVLATGTLTASAAGNTVNYNMAGAQTIKMPSGSTYYNLNLEGNNTKTITGNTIISGNLTITSTLDCNNFNINIGGNWNNSGAFTEQTATVTFDGSAAQSVTNTFGETFYNLTLNKPAGALTLNNNVIVSNTLTFTAGIIDANTGTLTLGTACGNEGALVYTAGAVTGKFERWINTEWPAENFLFPVGTSAYNRSALVAINVLSPCGSLIAEFIESNPGLNGLPLDDGISPDSIRNTFAEGYWTLTAANGLASTDYNLELTGNGFTSFPINAATRLLTRANAGSNWDNSGAHVAASGNTAKRNNISVLSAQYAFGDTSNCEGPVTSAISGADSVCNSDAGVSYSVDLHLGSIYTWTIIGGTQASGGNTESITVNWGTTGQVGNVRVVENNGCTNGAPVDKAVNIHTLPTSSITGSNAVGEFTDSVNYKVVPRAGYTYTWTITGGTLIYGQGTDSILVNWGAAGSGNVRVVASTGCPGTASPVDLPVNIYAIITSIASGAWGAASTWDCSCIPAATDNVVITSPYTVTLGANTTIKNFTINSGGTLSGGTRIMTVTGNLTVDGTYTSTNAIRLQGTGNVTLGGTGTINASGGISLLGGSITIPSSANLKSTSGNLIFNTAGISVSNNGVITFDFSIVNGMGTVTWTNETNSTLNIGGSIDGVLSASAAGNTVNYSGGGVQNIKCPSSGTYHHLSVSNAGTKTLACNVDINGNVSISGAAQLDVSSYNMTIAGNFINTSSNADPFFERSQTVTLDGTGAQSITYTPGETFYGLTVNNPSGTLTLNDNVTVSNTLTMTAGNINTGTDILKLGTGIGNTGTLTRTSGTIIGRFERWKDAAAGTILYPIGVSTDYRPASITFTSVIGGSLTAQFITINPGVNGLPLNDAGINVYNTFTEGYWNLTAANGLTSLTYDIDLTGNGFTSYTINSQTRILKRSSSVVPWTLNGIHTNASGNTAKRTGLIDISDFEFCFGDTAACAPPVTSQISGTDSVCTGATSVSYTVDAHPPNTYTWTITGGVQSGGGNTNSITVNWDPAPGGVGNVNVVESSNCGNGSPVDKAVNIHTLPTSPINGKDNVVEFSMGEPYSVTNNTGYTYNWTITGGTQASGGNSNSITVDWGAAGAGNVNVVASSNCSPDAGPVDLPVTIYGTITSIKTGNWNADTTWNCSCVPLITDNLVIANTHTVTLDVDDTVNNITINNGGTLNNGTNIVTVIGDYTVNGIHSGSGNIILSGIGSTIAGMGTITNTGELQITAGNKTIVSSASLAKPSGQVTIDIGLTVTNNGTITIGGNIVGNLVTSTWINGTNATLNAGGILLSTGTLTASASENTVNYNGSVGQNIKIPSTSYYNLTASGAGTKTLAGNIDVNGSMTINSALDVSLTNYNINLAGAWNNTGTFNEQNSTVTLDGSTTQSLTNTSSEMFYNLTVNKPSGTFTLNDNVIVSNTLTMSAGNINTGSDTLTLGTGTANVGTLSRTSGNITGRFKRWKNSIAGAITFPVGTVTDYRPALVTFNSVTGGSLTGEFVVSAPGNNGMPVTDGAFTIDTTFTEGYWTLSAANGLSSSDYDLELTGNGFTSFTITAATRLLSRASAGSPWDNPPNGSHVDAVPATNTAKRAGLSSFTQYAFGDTTACAGPPTSAITGDDSVCTGAAGKIYSVTNHPGNAYTWTVVGGSITSGQGTNSITVTWGSTGSSDANIRVIETDACTNGSPVDLPVTIHILPTSSITGNNLVPVNASGEVYSVTNTPGYTYTWVIAQGLGTIASGQFTNSITLNWGAVAGNDTVRVTASMGCGSAAPVNLPVTIFTVINSNASGNWNAPATWSCACIPPTTGSVTIQSIHNVSLTQNQTINNLTIDGSVTNNGFIFTVTGNLILNGSYAGTGEINLDGMGTTIQGNTGQMSNTGIVRIRNGNKTIGAGTEITKVQGGSFTILGGLTVTNNANTMTIASDLIGANAASTWINAENSTLKVYANVLTTGTLTATATGNTVEYYGDAAQNVKQTTYYNLGVTGSGGKTTLNANMIMTGNMKLTDTLDANGFNITVGANWTNTGGGKFLPGTGRVTFNGSGNDTINSAGQAFNNLDIAGSGSKILASALNVSGNLSITSSLDVSVNDYPVNIRGNWSNTGTFNANNGLVTFDGSVLQTLQDTTTFYGLTINNAAGVSVVSGANNLRGTLTLSNGSFNTNNSFTLVSNSSETARIAAITGGDIFGDIIMQRYVNAGATGWHFISSAISGTTVNDWDQEMVLSIPDGNEGCVGSPCSFYSVFRYNEATPGTWDNGYVAVTTVAEPINVGEGYWVYTGTGPSTTVPFTFDVRGPANKFAKGLSVSYTPSGLPSDDGWNMVANPYPSTIDWDKAGWTKTNMANAIYIWDPDAGLYASYVGGIGSNGGSRFIPSSQAFWVKATGAPALTATEPVKSATDQSFFKVTNSIPGAFRLSISGAGYTDETVIRFAQGANFAFDSDLDAYKLSYAYSPAPYLATVIGDSTDLSINSLPELTQDTAIALRVKWIGAWWISPQTGTFTISTSDFSTLPLSTCILLEDIQTGISTNLLIDTSYTFTLSDTASSSTPRFLLHIGTSIIKESISVSCNGANDGKAIAQGTGSGPYDYLWTDELGDTIKVTNNIFSPDTLSNLPPGVYSVKVANGSALCGDVYDTIVIIEPDTIAAYINQTNVSCKDGNDGSAALTVNGGIPPYNYLWNNGESTDAIYGVSAGTYTVTVTDNNGCTKIAQAIITEPPTIISAGFTVNKDTVYLSEGGTVQFTNNSTGASSYQWDFGDGSPLNTSVSPAHSYNNTGAYTISLIAINETCRDTFTYDVKILDYPPVSIKEPIESYQQIKIIPDDKGAFIEFNFAQLTDIKINVVNLLGQKVIEDNMIKVKRDKIRLDLQDKVRGVYFVKIRVGEHTFTRKIVH